jgi:hypothetical protein
MMDSNKDEAERCLDLGEQFLAQGRPDKAEKFLLKAERLFPSQRGKGDILFMNICMISYDILFFFFFFFLLPMIKLFC